MTAIGDLVQDLPDREPSGGAAVRSIPILMFGMERSGTTILSLMIGAHPEIAVPYPVAGLWYDFARAEQVEEGELSEARLDDIIAQLLAHPRMRDWDVTLDAREVRETLGGAGFPNVLRAFYEAYARHKNKPSWAQMDISTLDHLAMAARWFPDARFVHIVRDGRDVALSHQTMPFGAGNIAECAAAWYHRLKICEAVGHLLGPQRYYQFRYEDLILEPEKTLRHLCTFIGVEFSPLSLAYQQMIEEKVPADRLWLWPNLGQPPDQSKVARWKSEMTRSQRIVFEDIAGNLLGELGYEYWPRVPRSIRAESLGLFYHATRGGRLKRFRKRLGFDTRTVLERCRSSGAER